MVITMNKIKANNWTDAQWFNFICGIIRSDNFSGSSVDPPVPPVPPVGFDGACKDIISINDIVVIKVT